jgi:hypothetical protein
LSSTDTVFEPLFAMARSRSPSPSKSPLVTEDGFVPTANGLAEPKDRAAASAGPAPTAANARTTKTPMLARRETTCKLDIEGAPSANAAVNAWPQLD